MTERLDRAQGLQKTLDAFTREIEEANQALLDEVRGQLEEIRREMNGLHAELQVARLEVAAAQDRNTRTEKRLEEMEGALSRPVPEPVRPERSAAPAVQAEAPAPEPPPQPESEAQVQMRARYADIMQQIASGLDAQSIARQTGRPFGEVQLIMRLLKQAGSNRERR